MAPQPTEQDAGHSTLETVPKSDMPTSYAYSVPENYSPPYNEENANPHGTWPEVSTYPPQPRKRILTRWYFLIIYGLLIALIAGIIGGFVGKSIESKRVDKGDLNNNNGDVAAVQSACSTPTTASATNAAPSGTSTPSATAFVRTLPVPTTGCNPTNVQKSFKAFTTYINAGYTTYCNTGWWNDDLLAMSAATPSDCIEACAYYNQYKSSNERSCVGGGYIPAWWDQSKAMDEDGNMPWNCFLKANDSRVGRNDRDIEVVALCMDGACNDVLSSPS